jgi:hypothetical protein
MSDRNVFPVFFCAQTDISDGASICKDLYIEIKDNPSAGEKETGSE